MLKFSFMKHMIVLFVAIIVFGCTSAILIPTQADADRAKVKYGSSSVEELLEGKKLYETNCGTCHELKKPSSESEEGWKHEVPEMSLKVNKKARSEVLDAKKQEIILKYLVTMSTAKSN
jgi:cytochrome c5